MSDVPRPPHWFIGWDVGGWNCDNNGRSRDAVVILDAELRLVGKPWRGNLRITINEAKDTSDFLCRLFVLCDTASAYDGGAAMLAIDTPLGFSEAFQQLVTQGHGAGPIGNSSTNHYLFRRTERFLFEHGLKPLSAVKDMIGSQATKGMHVLSRFAPITLTCGVWSDVARLTAIEAYPSPCKRSTVTQALLASFSRTDFCHDDEWDALTCALIAYLYTRQRETLAAPRPDVPPSEGWIWLPSDALNPASPAKL